MNKWLFKAESPSIVWILDRKVREIEVINSTVNLKNWRSTVLFYWAVAVSLDEKTKVNFARGLGKTLMKGETGLNEQFLQEMVVQSGPGIS